MIQKHRIHTDIGRDQVINVEVKQDFDIMEILSLKFTQKDIYASGVCAEFGVVVGRVSANNGFGVPNAKISIFIPQSDLDADDPVISALYPYKAVTDKNDDGYRYNLLPNDQQHPGHISTGTFFDQEDILTREENLEVFENYYKYTVKTNSSGDFMIWGVPIGTQTIHVDVDLSDIGCFSLRPYDFIRKGVGADKFERYYNFKSSTDIDGLPQIVSFDKTIEVYPFWGNEELCQIGITRTDFDLTEKDIKIEPISLILISTVTDDSSHAIKRNERIRKNSGYKCNLQTTTGKIECVRYTGNKVQDSQDPWTLYPELEYFNVTEVIDENGVAMAVLPMNLEYVYTNEFGEEEITNDKNKGIPTHTIARFRFTLDFDNRKVAVGHYLVPNIREFNPNDNGSNSLLEYNEGMLTTYQFSDVFEDYIKIIPPTGMTISSAGYDSISKTVKKDLMLGTNNSNVPEDYFYKFIYGKVYTVSSFQGTHYEIDRRDTFLGIKQIRPNIDEDCSSKANYLPTNYAFKNRVKFSLLLGQVILFVQFLYSAILIKFAEAIGRFFYALSRLLFNIGIRRWRPFRKISQHFEDNAYSVQDKFTKTLPLTIYPDCEECTNDDISTIVDASFVNDYCRVAELFLDVRQFNEVHTGFNHRDQVYIFIPNTNLTSFPLAYLNQIDQPSFLSYTGNSQNYLFPDEYAKDSEGECSGSTTLYYYQLSGLTSYVIPPEPPDNTTARYIASVYPYAGDWSTSGVTLFSEFVGFFTTDSDPAGELTNIKLWNYHHPTQGWWTTLGTANNPFFTYEEWNEISGMDYNSLPVVGNYNSNLNSDAYTNAVVRIYDRTLMKASSIPAENLAIETGCEKYDKTYDESIALGYIWNSGTTYTYTATPFPMNPSGLPGQNTYPDDMSFREFGVLTTTPPMPYTYLESTIIAKPNAMRMPYKKAYTKIPNAIYDRKTKSGFSEFRNGIFTLIPVIKGSSNNLKALQEWYRRKRVGLSFCGGITNYSFIDNWLNGLLYFFKFDKRIRWDKESRWDLNQRGSKFPRNLIFYNVIHKLFYYRSTPFDGTDGIFIGQSYNNTKEILHPTTFYDVGVRDEFLYQICTNPNIDPTCSVVRDVSVSSYQDPANIMEYGINYRLDLTNAKTDVDDFFTGDQYGGGGNIIKSLDGDLVQLISINCETGIEAFDMDSPHYVMFNGELMDPEDPIYTQYFKGSRTGTQFGPTPIDLKFDYNGAFIRGCLNSRLGDYSQRVPFYLWEKGAEGFGPYGVKSDQQKWDRAKIAVLKLQRIFSINNESYTHLSETNYLMNDDNMEAYLLKPMTINHDTFAFRGNYEDMLERFEVISFDAPPTGYTEAIEYSEGDLWMEVLGGSLKDPINGNIYVVLNESWTKVQNQISPAPSVPQYYKDIWETFLFQTAKNYRGANSSSCKQVLSTPFLFYFGLRPEKTALDILIKYFGPKGAFPTPTPNIPILPTPTPIYIIPSPTPSLPAPSPTWYPGMSPTPTPSPQISFFVAPPVLDWEYDQVGPFSSDPNEYLFMSNMSQWYLTLLGSGEGGSMYYLSYSGLTDDMPLGDAPISELPSWLNMEVQVLPGPTWQSVSFHQPYSYILTNLRLYPNSVNDTSYDRSVNIYFSPDDVNVFMGGDQYITVIQRRYIHAIPPQFEWADDLSGYGCEIKHTINGTPYQDPTHGMSAGSNQFDLTVWTDCIDQWVPWSIVRNGSITIASGSGNPNGLHVQPGHAAVKSGMLSEMVQNGDVITITIGTSEIE